MPLPEKDEMFHTKGKMLQDITVSLGGRVAEEIIFDDITTGASQDIKQATMKYLSDGILPIREDTERLSRVRLMRK